MGKACVVAAVLGRALCLTAGQTPQESWESLRHLRPGEEIQVVDAQMKSHPGRFAEYGPDAIVLHSEGREIIFARAEVASIKRRGQSHRRRNVLAGLAIGAAGGLTVGLIRGKTYHEQGETPVFVMVWTPIGAAAGAVVGATLPSRAEVTLYRASAVRRWQKETERGSRPGCPLSPTPFRRGGQPE